MNVLEILRVAARALLRNKMRSVLTTLGIVIGVLAVIAMVAVGEGAKKRVEDAFASMGSDLLIILPGTTTKGGAFGGFGSMPTLTWTGGPSGATEAFNLPPTMIRFSTDTLTGTAGHAKERAATVAGAADSAASRWRIRLAPGPSG